jgi:hypothetical protein
MPNHGRQGANWRQLLLLLCFGQIQRTSQALGMRHFG